jgi:hypothetical protein
VCDDVTALQPRPGETVQTLEAAAFTATTETLLIINNTQNIKWENTLFQYATNLHASGPKGFVDTQSAYLYQDGEPPVNIHASKSTNITFAGCGFSHLGGVYALGADGTVRVFRQKFTLEDAIGSHAYSLEALACV